jgi:serine phosphatase RsbU (regulator of sigma subunit)
LKRYEDVLSEFRQKLDSIPDKKQRAEEIIGFVMIYGDSYGPKMVPYIEEGIRLSKECGFDAGEVICYYNLHFFNEMTQGTTHSNSIYATLTNDLVEMAERLKPDKEWYHMGLNLLSFFYWFRGEYEKGFNTIFEAIRESDELSSLNRAWNQFALAVFYFDTKDFENSKMYYEKSRRFFTDAKHDYGIARASTGLGSIAIIQDRKDEALQLLESSTVIFRDLGHYSGLSRALNDMGTLEKAKGNYEKAIKLFHETAVLREEINHTQGLATTCTELGETYLLMKEYEQALEQFSKGLRLSIDVRSLQKQMRLHQLLYLTYKEFGNTEAALSSFEKFFEIKSKLLSDEANNNIKRLQTKFEKEKSEKEAELERMKNEALTKANAIIEQKNKDITDSINYAKRIQLGILPSEETLQKCFNEYFVLYQPKDIVSGDFYWAVESGNRETGDKLSIIAAVDCTGHGVPGAFMSMLGNTLLNQTILNPDVKSAADVLDYLNSKLPENLKSTSAEMNIRDGMDMTLCIFDLKNMKMQFAGANNPCWIIRDNELTEIKGDKQPISASTDLEKKKFSNHVIDLQKNDCIYLFTDGYADQFGGANEKKFTYKRLKELLLQNSRKDPSQQKAILERTIEDWKGSLEQIDDICMIGIRV